MSEDLIQIGTAQAHYNASNTRVLKYSIELYHKGLKEHKIISAPEVEMLQNKASLQVLKWEEKWDTISLKTINRNEKEANFEEANNRTLEAQHAFTEIENLLNHTLSINDAVDWDSLKKKNSYQEK